MRPLPAIAMLALAAVAVTACDTEIDTGTTEKGRLTEELRRAHNEIEQLTAELDESRNGWHRLTEEHTAGSLERDRLAGEVDRLEATHQKSLERETALEAELNERKSEVAALSFALDEYRAKHWATIRAGAIGTHFESITTTHGESYRDVTILEITEGSMRFQHANGIATVSFEDLPDEIQDRYAYSPTRFIEETISDLAPVYLMTPEEIAATGPGPVPPPQESRPTIPPEVVRQQLAKLEKYVADLDASLKRAEAMRDNVDKIDRGSKIKTAQADKWKMAKELDAHVMVYRQRLGAAKRQVEILKTHLPAEEKP